MAEVDGMKEYVNNTSVKAEVHRETLQRHYNEKLGKMKEVCSQYFSKYEKYLMNNQELVKSLEEKQDEWIARICKPQEANQARLFSIDQRIKEGELQR